METFQHDWAFVIESTDINMKNAENKICSTGTKVKHYE